MHVRAHEGGAVHSACSLPLKTDRYAMMRERDGEMTIWNTGQVDVNEIATSDVERGQIFINFINCRERETSWCV